MRSVKHWTYGVLHTECIPRPTNDGTSSVLDDYLVEPKLSLLDKARIQAQVLVPVLRALRFGSHQMPGTSRHRTRAA
jgi:hypothetical protein